MLATYWRSIPLCKDGSCDGAETSRKKTILINRTHISHFGLTLNTAVVQHDTLLQLTGTLSSCKRLAFYCGLELRQRGERGEQTYQLVDSHGVERGQLHDFATPQLVMYKAWFEQETA